MNSEELYRKNFASGKVLSIPSLLAARCSLLTCWLLAIGYWLLAVSPAWADTGLLFFSDHPERVASRGLLFSGGLSRNFPARFFFYHQGTEAVPQLSLDLQLYNPVFHKKAEFQLIKELPAPELNAFKVGHQAVAEFLPRLANRQFTGFTLQPGETLSLAQQLLPPDMVGNGIFEFRLLSGGPVFFNLFARKFPQETVSCQLLSNPLDTHNRGVYLPYCLDREVNFDLKDNYSYLPVGEQKIPDLLGGRDLKGAYGIIYRIKVNLSNSTAKPGKAGLFFQPRGGSAALVLYFRDKTWEVKPQTAFSQVLLFRVELEPGEKKSLEFYTMPEGASNYPIRLIWQTSWR